MKTIVLAAEPLGFQWKTRDPFLFCVHHNDAYPAGNADMGPVASLEGRDLGMDFQGKDGWRMYHGLTVPGFPCHPHRGFETVTIARSGFIDHSDSLGAAARFGEGDVQWMTAGRGIQHSEMFPLRNQEGPNPAELFQIWLNLPKANKMVEPHFTMLWDRVIPRLELRDEAGRLSVVRVVAGRFGDSRAPAPPPDSWASCPESDLAIFTLKLEPQAELRLPAAHPGTNRTLYFFKGSTLRVQGEEFKAGLGLSVVPEVELELVNGPEEAELLLLQGRPIGEPIAQHGPFVMNTQAEIHQAFSDYQRTRFGSWPWGRTDPVHPRERGRFARHADGKLEEG